MSSVFATFTLAKDEIMIKVGLSKSCTTTVVESNTAAAVASGDMKVFATPMMVALMENAALTALAPYLNEGESTVGISVNVKHTRASAIGRNITATATVTEVDGRRIAFEVVAKDDLGEIGRGTHERFIVNKEKFLGKL